MSGIPSAWHILTTILPNYEAAPVWIAALA